MYRNTLILLRPRKDFPCFRLRSTVSMERVETEFGESLEYTKTETDDSRGPTLPFARSKIGSFFQRQPSISNQFMEDVTLRSYLKRHLPDDVLLDINADLEKFGERVATDIRVLGERCEQEPPKLRHYHAWGRRIDELITCPAWKEQKKVSAEEGLISLAYARKHGPWSRVHQIAKNYLYAPSSGLYSCPLAMTDGASKICETLKDTRLDHAFKHLTSTDPNEFWTSGQWMTERKGGSDVGSGTETLAVPQADGSYKLYGYKWFSSATDSDMTLTLGRVVDENGQIIQGSKGLSMFYLEIRDQDGNLNGIEIQRLKDKLGTRQLPTAELLLDGAKALLVSEKGRGVSAISNMLTITRIHNTASSAAGMRRIINLARDYCNKRTVFGSEIGNHKLHIKTLASMEVEQRASLLLTLELGRLLGKEEVGTATDTESDLLRILTPIAKLYTAKQAVAVASEGLECFGGMGYLEDTFLPSMFRDAQVLPIWEGTTNILSLDVLRALMKTQGDVLKALYSDVAVRCNAALDHPELKPSAEKVKQAADQIVDFASTRQQYLEVAAREFAFSIARTYLGALLLDHATWKGATPQDVLVAQRWCGKDLTPITSEFEARNYDADAIETERKLVFDGYSRTKSKL